MRVRLNFLYCLLAMAMMVSCSIDPQNEPQVPEEIQPEENQPAAEYVTAIHNATDTRTYLGVDGLTVYWSAGDKMGIYTQEGSDNLMFVAESASDAYGGKFKGVLNGEIPAYAYYPYSANAGDDPTNLTLSLSPEQNATLISDYDFRTSIYVARRSTRGEYTLNFRSVLSMYTIEIDAADSPFQYLNLSSVTVQPLPLAEGDPMPAFTGDFTLDLTSGTTTFTGNSYDYATLTWAEPYPLTNGKATASMFFNPESVKEGMPLLITICAEDGTTASIRMTSVKNCEPNTRYTISLALADLEDRLVYEGNPLTAVSFKNANNSKMIASSLYEGPLTNAYYTNSTTEYDVAATYDAAQGAWVATIPYLCDFSDLVADFTTTEEGATVSVDGVEQVSGVTANDFNGEVTYVVTSANGAARKVKVKVQNTGLPVVTINGTVYSKSTDFDDIEGTSQVNIDGVDYTAGVRLRGNSTQVMPKKPYAIKLDKKAEVLGMPKHKRWVLLANWLDRTMLRNDLAFYLAQQTGAWAPRGKSVELVLNGVHVGNYFLCEQIKMDDNRVAVADIDITELSAQTEDAVAAEMGFLLECDQGADATEIYFKVNSPVPFYVYVKDPSSVAAPGNGVNTTVGYTYIKKYFTQIGTALQRSNWATVAELIDYQSFADHWMFTELTANQESKHPKSFYMHKDAGGKLKAGPAWDYDWATFISQDLIGNANHSEVSSTAGQIKDKFTMRYTMWYTYLFNDPAFKAVVKERWIANKAKFQSALNYLNQQAALVKVSDEYNHAMWPIEGMIVNSSYTRQYGFPNRDESLSFDEAVARIYSNLEFRLSWLDTQINNL